MLDVFWYVPIELCDVARSINRSLDFDDTGGAGGFCTTEVIGDTEFSTYSRKAPQEYIQRLSTLLMVPEELYGYCRIDYAKRWPELEAPTLAEVLTFCQEALCYVGHPLGPEPEDEQCLSED